MFDENIYKKYGVLTSIAIQKRYSEAISRRKAIDIIENYWLIDIPKLDKTTITIINVDTNEKNVYINSENANNNPQSKVKESKEKKSKENIDKKDIDNFFKNKNGKSFPQNFPQVELLINSGYIPEDDEHLEEYNNFIDLLLLDYRVEIVDKAVSYFITNKPDIVNDRLAYFQTSLKNNLDKITGRKVKVNASESLNMFKQFLEA